MAHVLVFQCFRISILSGGVLESALFLRYVPGCRLVPVHTTLERSRTHAPATSATTVKTPIFLSTPEQAGCAAAIDQSLTIFWTLVERLHAAAQQQQPIHQVEEAIFRDLLAMGRSLLQAFLALSGDGDAGPTLTVAGDGPSDPPQILPRLDGPRPRPYLSIFGAIPIRRVCYGPDRVEAAPLDARSICPDGNIRICFSSGWASSSSMMRMPKRSRNSRRSWDWRSRSKLRKTSTASRAATWNPFQIYLPTPAATEEGPILVVTADCKGVPWCARHCRLRRRPPTPRCRSWRTNAVARARRPTRRRWRRWARSIRSIRSCAPPTR